MTLPSLRPPGCVSGTRSTRHLGASALAVSSAGLGPPGPHGVQRPSRSPGRTRRSLTAPPGSPATASSPSTPRLTRAHACSRPSPRRPPPRGVRGQGPSYSLMNYLDPETAPSRQQVTVVSAGGTDGLRRFLHHPCSGPTVTSSAVLSWSPGWKRPCSTRALTGPADGHATLILPFSVEANFNLFLRILKAILIA